MANAQKLAVLMATFNGARFIKAQLVSIAEQSRPPDLLMISDDGSDDGTKEIATRFAETAKFEVQVIDGPGQGGAANFLHLLQKLPAEVTAVAFSDQDDVWLPHKLERGLAHVAQNPDTLYCGHTIHCDEALNRIGLSRRHKRPATFRNALVQNICAGNTIILGADALEMMRRAGAPLVVVHDWWTYQIVTGAGGQVYYDDNELLLYRQHAENEIGANEGSRAQWRRLKLMLRGELSRWIDLNTGALAQARHLLTKENAEIFDAFQAMRTAPAATRLKELRRLGLYRQGLAGQGSLWLAAALRKL